MMLIGNGRVITRDPEQPFLECGGVAVQNGLILEVGDWTTLQAKYPQAERLDAHGGVIMPALINTHEHIYSAMARGLSVKGYHPKGFLDILEGMWWNIDRHLTLEQTRLSALTTLIDCVKNGVTTIFDHHASFYQIPNSLFAIEEAAQQVGIRRCLCYEISDRDGEDLMKQSVLENEAFIRYAQQDNSGMVAGMMGMHASFTLSDKTFDFARAHKPEGAGYHIHVAEGQYDLEHCQTMYGKPLVKRLYDLGVLGRQTLAAHCIYINEVEMELLKATDTMVVHNPESNMGNACGCPPTMKLVEKGILTGLGTDGYTHDMLESYKVANILHKHHLQDPNAAWSEVPQMLFENNAKIAARYFPTPLGQLKAGYAADVIVTDYIPITPMDASNVNSHILFGMNGRSVIHTVCNGKILMKDRELTFCDEEEVSAQVRQGAGQLWQSINGEGR
jgi:putative selenium metabolism protein SsnA